ncbi:MAG: glycosyltransferase family 2 protein [Bacteroidota bacterium]
MPFFTVIIPTYNRADLIEVAINSVLQQSFTDFEIIVIDDASQDDTEKVVGKFSDIRIRYIKNELNIERSRTRNKAINLAKGNYITFLDSDDYYLENHLQNFYDEISSVKLKNALFFCNKKTLENKVISSNVFMPISENPVEYFLLIPVMPLQVCVSKDILLKHQFNPYIHINEDSLLWMEIASEYPVYQSAKETCVYLTHENNSINVQKNNVFKNRLDSINIALANPNIKKNISREKQQLAKSNCYFGMFNYHHFQKNTFKKIVTILEAIFLYPNIKLKNKIYLLLSCLPFFSLFFKHEP